MRALSGALVGLLFSLGVACSSSGDDAPTTDANIDTSGGDVADATDTLRPPSDAVAIDTADPPVDAGCNSVKNVALAVTENNVAANLPLGAGGLIADGIYVVTAVTRYNGPGGKVGPGTRTLEETISITDGKLVNGVRKVDSDLGYGYNAGIAPSSGSLAWKQTCPSGEVGVTYDYSVGETTLEIFDKVQKIGTTYTRKNLTP